jgi:hypothetical protein
MPGNITNHDTLADAILDLHRQIVARYGCLAEVLDDLEIKTLPCPDERGGPTGTVIAAYPRTGITDDNVLVAYFCAAPQRDAADAKEL